MTVRGAVRRTFRWPGTSAGELAVVTVAFALVLCVAFFPLVFQDRTFAPNGRLAQQSGREGADYPYRPPDESAILDGGAFIWLFEPMGRVRHEVYADGDAPLWNPYTGLGVPLLGDLQTAPFGPFYAPLFFKPTQKGWNLTVLVRLLVGGVGAFALLRALGARPPAALLAAFGYLLVPAYILWMHSVSLSLESLAPWLLLSVLALLRRPAALPFAGVALLTAAAVVGGQPEVLVVLAYVAAAWAMFWWARTGRSWTALALTAAAGIAGGLIAAPQLLLGAEYVGLANDLHGGTLGEVRLSAEQLKVALLGDFADAGRESLAILMVGLALAGVAGMRSSGVATQGFWIAAILVWSVRVLDLPGAGLVGLLPGIGDINLRRYGMFVYVLGGAVLAAGGIQAILRRSPWALGALGAAVLIPLVLWPTGGFAEGNAVPALLLACGLVLAGLAAAWRPLALVLVAVLIAVQFVLLTPRDYPRVFNAFSPRPFVSYIRDNMRPGDRVLGVRQVLHPQIPAAMQLEDPRNGLALKPRRYDSYLIDLAGTREGRFSGLSSAEVAGSPFLEALGVRYVAAPRDAGSPGTGFRPVFEGRNPPLVVWENDDAYRAWIPEQVRFAETEEEAVDVLRSGAGDLRELSVVEEPTDRMRSATGSGSVTVERVGWNDVRLRVNADDDAVVVLADQYFPGWEARVDGEATPIRAANVAMRAVAVPEGEHVLEFEYRPTGWRYGLLASLAGVLVLVVGAAFAQRAGRSVQAP